MIIPPKEKQIKNNRNKNINTIFVRNCAFEAYASSVIFELSYAEKSSNYALLDLRTALI